jgi:hypothetical protein
MRETIPYVWKSLVTGKEYPFHRYTNHGFGGEYRGYKDLPAEGYPYTLIYIENNLNNRTLIQNKLK